MKSWWIFRMILLGAIYFLVLSLGVMTLWNYLLPNLFNAPAINFLQALGLFALAKILFGGIGPDRWGMGYYARRSAWKRKFEQKWSGMTPEEKENFKRNFKYRCGNWYQQESEMPVEDKINND